MRVRHLTGNEEIEAVASRTPWLRWGVDLRNVDAWHDEDSGAVALVRTRHPYGTTLAAVGDPDAAVNLALDLAPRLAPELELTSVTLPRAAAPRPGPVFGPAPAGVDWEWMWTASEPPDVPGEERVGELDVTSDAARRELSAFLAACSPRHSAEPGDEPVRAWLGVRAERGEILASVALYEEVPGLDLMASVAVAPAARGQGLGLAVAAAATRRSLRERPPVACVDLYSDNDAARALYAKLGYRLDQAFTSYRVR